MSGDGGMKASGNDGCDPEEHRIAAGPVTAVPRQRKDYVFLATPPCRKRKRSASDRGSIEAHIGLLEAVSQVPLNRNNLIKYSRLEHA